MNTDHAHELSDADRIRLSIEGARWRNHGTKEAVVREQLDESMTTYAMRLNQLIDQPAVLAADPVLVRRLQRLREQRQAARGLRPTA